MASSVREVGGDSPSSGFLGAFVGKSLMTANVIAAARLTTAVM